MSRRTAGARGVLLVTALLLPACGVDPQPAPEPVPAERLPSSSLAQEDRGRTERIRVWGAREQRLVPVFVEVDDTGPRARLTALLELGEPGQQPLTALPEGTRLLRVQRSGDRVDLTLSRELRAAPMADLPLALGQLVFTVTEVPGARRVQVRAGDERVPYVDANGRTLTRPLVRSDFDGLVQRPADD
jgi:hypothetical protein